jgi:hypothetical protein
MNIKRDVVHIVFLSLILIATGCARTDQYRQLAVAGSTYTAAADKLLITTRNLGIDSSSEALLRSNRTLGKMQSAKTLNKEERIAQSLEIYGKTKAVDEEIIETITRLRGHSRLLSRYFLTLNKLAASDSPEAISIEMQGITTSLNQVGTLLRGSPIITNQGLITTATSAIVAADIRTSLKEEFERSHELIINELDTQERMLIGLSVVLGNAMEEIIDAQEKRLVEDPFVEQTDMTLENQAQWINDRRSLLITKATVTELTTAQDLVAKLRGAFIEVVQGNSEVDFDTLILDISTFFSLIELLDS